MTIPKLHNEKLRIHALPWLKDAGKYSVKVHFFYTLYISYSVKMGHSDFATNIS